MTKIRLMDENDKQYLVELVKVMIGDKDKEKVSLEVVNDFYKDFNYHVFVIELKKQVIGFGVLKFNAFEGASGVCEIVWLGIDDSYKRNGYGQILVKEMEKYAQEKKIRKLYLKTSVYNKNAVCFWIKQDYLFEARMLNFSLKSYDDYYLSKEIEVSYEKK